VAAASSTACNASTSAGSVFDVVVVGAFDVEVDVEVDVDVDVIVVDVIVVDGEVVISSSEGIVSVTVELRSGVVGVPVSFPPLELQATGATTVSTASTTGTTRETGRWGAMTPSVRRPATPEHPPTG